MISHKNITLMEGTILDTAAEKKAMKGADIVVCAAAIV